MKWSTEAGSSMWNHLWVFGNLMIQGFIFLLFLTFNFCLSFFGFRGFVSFVSIFLEMLVFSRIIFLFPDFLCGSFLFLILFLCSWLLQYFASFANFIAFLCCWSIFAMSCVLFHGVSSFHICTTPFHYPWLMSLLLDVPVEKWKKESRNGPIEIEFGARCGIVIVNPNRILVHFVCGLNWNMTF